MYELAEGVPLTVVMITCGTALLLGGDPFGRDLITLAVGIYVGQTEN